MAVKKSKKATKRGGDPGPDTQSPLPEPVKPEEAKRIVSSFVNELHARPDAQVQIVRDAIPSLQRLLGVDIPQVDLNPREQAAPPAPGPMTQNRVVDPREAVKDGESVVKVNPASGGIEAQNIVAVGEALESVNKKASAGTPKSKKKATKSKK